MDFTFTRMDLVLKSHFFIFNEHWTHANICPQFAKIVRTGRSKQMAQVFAMFNSSWSPGPSFVTNRFCAFAGGALGGGSSSLSLDSRVTAMTSRNSWKDFIQHSRVPFRSAAPSDSVLRGS